MGINDLPVEILSSIFLRAALRDRISFSKFCQYNIPSNYARPITSAPFVFLQVCGHWRAVANSTPILWTSIDASQYAINVRTRQPYAIPVEALEYWLSLSHSLPLDLHMHAPPLEPPTTARRPMWMPNNPHRYLPPAHSVNMLDTIARQSFRWKSLSMVMNAILARSFADVISNNFMPCIFKKLEIHVVGSHHGAPELATDDFVRAIASITSLTELYLELPWAALQYCQFPLLNIPWGQLTTVFMDMRLRADEAAVYLSHSTNATTVTFKSLQYPGIDSSTPAYPDHKSLPSLKSLTMHGHSDIYQAFDCFSFPNLEKLDIRIEESRPSLRHTSLQELIDRSCPPLKYLSMWTSKEFSASDVALYLLTPSLQAAPDVALSCKNVHRAAMDLVETSSHKLPLLWTWMFLTEVQYVGWKKEFKQHVETNAQVINHKSLVI